MPDGQTVHLAAVEMCHRGVEIRRGLSARLGIDLIAGAHRAAQFSEWGNATSSESYWGVTWRGFETPKEYTFGQRKFLLIPVDKEPNPLAWSGAGYGH